MCSTPPTTNNQEYNLDHDHYYDHGQYCDQPTDQLTLFRSRLFSPSQQHCGAMTAAAARIDALDGIFDDHPSLSASLSDFEPGAGSEAHRSPQFRYPSIHSGFKSEYAPSEPVDSDSTGGYSPPAWR